ncbi:MAG: sigma-70 family RNA polymerase sigma factor [Alphaproteobacteria bacterium]|nr:sigma-70 family RNA polymerase sigma factor [Alphaproteobacteria bacterium]
MPLRNDEIDQNWRRLAAAAQKGDAASYRTLLTELVPVIKRSLSKSLPSPDIADDIVQEVLISVHKALHTYEIDRPFTPWLMAIVNFRRTDFLRGYYAAHENKQVPLDSVEIPDYLNQDDKGAQEEQEAHLKDALNSLPEKQKNVVEMLKLEGLSTREVADKTGMSESAIKVTMHRALQKLKEKIKREAGVT